MQQKEDFFKYMRMEATASGSTLGSVFAFEMLMLNTCHSNEAKNTMFRKLPFCAATMSEPDLTLLVAAAGAQRVFSSGTCCGGQEPLCAAVG